MSEDGLYEIDRRMAEYVAVQGLWNALPVQMSVWREMLCGTVQWERYGAAGAVRCSGSGTAAGRGPLSWPRARSQNSSPKLGPTPCTLSTLRRSGESAQDL